MIRIPREVTWWYWLITVALLAVGLAGLTWGLVLAIELTLLQTVHFAQRAGHRTAFAVQVRLAYLGLLLLGLWPLLAWVHWMQLLGTVVRVAIGYCLLARLVSLMPWNRVEPLSMPLLRRTFLTLTELEPCASWSQEGGGAVLLLGSPRRMGSWL